MNEKTMNRPLSEAERALVERYHSLIYRVIGDLHLGTDAAADYTATRRSVWCLLHSNT